jgi:FkbM family methyltransferase
MRVDLLMVNDIGPGFTSKTNPLGGSELEMCQIATGLAARGRKVIVANNVTEETVCDGVKFIPIAQLKRGRLRPPSEAAQVLYLERTTSREHLPQWFTPLRTIVRATDVYHKGYDVHVPLKNWLLVGVTQWHVDLFKSITTNAQRRVINPILGPIPLVEKVRSRFVYASAPMKGLKATIDLWKQIYPLTSTRRAYCQPELVIVTPGHFDFYGDSMPQLTPRDREEFRIRIKGSPSIEDYRAEIARAEGLFFVLDGFVETYCNVAVIAERAGTRTHILALNGFGGIPEAIIDHRWLTSDKSEFVQSFLEALKNPQDIREVRVDIRSSEALIPAWDELLFGGLSLPAKSLPAPAKIFGPLVHIDPVVDQHRIDTLERVDPHDTWGVDQILVHEIYNIPYFTKTDPVILDIGANIGCATLFFKTRYPNAIVHAYEPHPRAQETFMKNVGHMDRVALHRAAVIRPKTPTSVKLYEGKCGTYASGLTPDPVEVHPDKFHEVRAISASTLPAADILKIDTEGCETEILANYAHVETLSAIALEWHSQEAHTWILNFLQKHGFVVTRDVATCATRGDLVAVRGSLVTGATFPDHLSTSPEATFPDDPAMTANKEPLGPFFGEMLSLLRTSLAPGGSELGLGLMLFSLAASTRAANIVEIGRFKGFSTLALAAALKLQDIGWQECASGEQRPDVDYPALKAKRPRQVISIDPFPMKEADELLTKADLSEYVRTVPKRSQEIQDIQGGIDLLFIDGSHELEDVRADVQKFVPWVKSGGYFVIHDYYGWFQNGQNGSAIAKVVHEELAGFEQVLVDTGYASFVVFRKTKELLVLSKAPARTDGRPTVGLVAIAKGTEVSTVLARALVSIRSQVDAITIVCDAEPAAARVAEALGATVVIRPTPEANYKTGVGFIAGARNDALDLAERRTDYVLIVDPDDYFEGTIPQVLDKDAYEVVIRDSSLEYSRPQLFRSGKGFRYHGIRHEVLQFQGSCARAEGLFYVRSHSSYGHQDQDPPKIKFLKHARDLQKWLLDNPDDARATFYLAQSYADAGEAAQAIGVYETRIAMGGWDEERYMSALRIGVLRAATSGDPTADLLRAHQMAPHRAEALMALAQWHRHESRKNFALAYMFAKQAAEIPRPAAVGLFLQPSVYAYETTSELAICAYWAGHKKEALELFQQVAEKVPADKKPWAMEMVALCQREVR